MNANYFFEMFFKDYDGSLIDVPVLITNFYDSNGATPNARGTSMPTWRLVRRFFIYDSVSGIESNYSSGKAVPTVIRYPLSISLQVSLDPD